jgi:hypothetical protein
MGSGVFRVIECVEVVHFVPNLAKKGVCEW